VRAITPSDDHGGVVIRGQIVSSKTSSQVIAFTGLVGRLRLFQLSEDRGIGSGRAIRSILHLCIVNNLLFRLSCDFPQNLQAELRWTVLSPWCDSTPN
jgi:hypothetical protein